MEHKYQKEITCPYCNHEEFDSWQFTEESGLHACGSCEREFNVSRDIEVTYSTSKIDCEDNESQHDYGYESAFVSKRKFEGRTWSDLPESEWRYVRINQCSVCDDKEYVDITKDKYHGEYSIK